MPHSTGTTTVICDFGKLVFYVSKEASKNSGLIAQAFDYLEQEQEKLEAVRSRSTRDDIEALSS